MADQALSKGANTSLLQRSEVEEGRLQAVVRWSDPGGSTDIDVSALLLGADGLVRSDDDFVFYNAPAGGDGSVRLLGKRADEDAGEDRVAVDLEALPAAIERVVIAASMDGGDTAGFGDVHDLGLVLLDAAGRPTVRFDITDAGTETAIVLGEFYLRGAEWRFRAVGQGWDSGLVGLATDYGITVDDSGPASPDVADPSTDDTTTVDIATVDIAAADITAVDIAAADITAVDIAAADITAVDIAAVDIAAVDTAAGTDPLADLVDAPDPADGPGEVAAPAAADGAPTRPDVPAARRGVRTRKKRTTGTAIAPLTLAVDPSWQPARLFSVSGVGVGEEQEKRATSTLMSTMMAVRDFGRALVSRFGGPAGTIETYLEVPFTLDERTVIPDAVIRVARAGRIWTALLETKTGASPLRADQVDRYLDLARQQGYDAVITLSNDLAPTAGTHPVEVDGRKLRKVALHHISWSEVLHEAEMQLAHRGVDDRLQAWLLAELIRYLRHPRSGAAGFDDMGPAWVPVREAVAAGTLRATDRKIGLVTTSWDKLIRHLCLRLTSQLGVVVTPVLPRGIARDPAARAQTAMARLADDGTLHSVLRVPGAIGVVEVTADLRTGQVRTSVQVDAPREGTGTRRINWMLRQLKEAPDTLLVEIGFARRGQTSCELLKDVRDNATALLPDPAADVRTIRLSLSAPLGTKRGGLRRAFIPSVTAAVDAFYADIVGGLRPSAAPKLPADVAQDAIAAVESDRASGGGRDGDRPGAGPMR